MRPVVPTAYTLEIRIRFFSASAFEGLYVAPFQRESKTLSSMYKILVHTFWSVSVLFRFLEKRGTNKYCLRKVNLVFYMQIFILM